jgi:elongation factor Ts
MITAQLVKELRERTGISMMDCKNALTETNGDVDAAIEVLRKKSVLKAEKKADRATNEGALVVGVTDTYGFIVEVNTETDFAAKDQDFQEFLNVLREYCIANKPGSLEELNDGFKDNLLQIIQKIGENIKISNYQMIEGDASSISSYIHSDGKLASLVLLANSNDSLGKDIAMQVAANNPLAISPDDIDVAILDKEKEIALATLENENKPEEIKEKIVLGKLNKFKQENSLLEQPFIKNPDQKIQDLTKDNSILGIIRRKVGE